MDFSIIQIILAFIVASIVGMASILDEAQFHRPLIACTLMGLVLGDIQSGIIVGGTLEMLALGWMNIGAAIAPDAALASIISVILVVVGKQDISTAIALAIPIAAAGQVLAYIARTITVAMQHFADSAVQTGSLATISFWHIVALLVQGLRISIPSMIVLFTAGTSAVQELLDSIPFVITDGLRIAGGMIVVVGYAMVINMMRAGYLMPFFFAGFVVAAFTNFNLVALGVLGTVMALLFIQLHPKYNASKGQVVLSQNDEFDNRLD